jgi:pimeloyl-ACP methyl ester carboxylesterase
MTEQANDMAKWFDSYVVVNGMKLHYYRTGGNKPQVVFNHGAGGDGLCWTRVAKELETDYDVIIPDGRGHGKSSSGNGDYSNKQRVADLFGIIQALKLDHPVVGGHSMGADTTLHLVIDHPEICRAIILEDPPINLPGEPLFSTQPTDEQENDKAIMHSMLMLKRMPKPVAIRLARKSNPTYPDDEILPTVEARKRVKMDFLNLLTTLDFTTPDPVAAFRNIQMPVLLFIGDKEKMSIVSQSTAQKIAEANPNVRVVHLEGASHDIRRTRFDGYMPALKRFLDEVYQS